MTDEIQLPFDVELSANTLLKAGELECMYELGKLRYIRRGKTELLRMIYAPVRSLHWVTLPYTIEDEKIIIDKDSFSIQYTALYKEEVAVYKAFISIEGKADSSISFSMKGEALAAFKRNRIGICVHHPIKECAGQQVTITRPDGNQYQSVFPEIVSPQQPFLDIRQMEWITESGTNVQVSFEGDIFETEDQRNWSDSSYKTYSTPLHIPFPVKLEAGDAIHQIVTIKVAGAKGDAALIKNEWHEEKIAFPKIGFSRSVNHPPVTKAEIEWLQKIPFHHYRVTLFMHQEGWQQELNIALQEATLLKVKLELVLFFSDQHSDELDALLVLLHEKQQLLYSVLVLHKNQKFSPADLLLQVYPQIKKSFPAVLVGYGTDANFVDLNRNRPVENVFDFVSYSLHPQAHMEDGRSILENLDNQPDMIGTAKKFAPGKQIFVSPVTFKDRNDTASGFDARQYTSMTACWMLMSLQQLSAADSISFCELFGKAGLLHLAKDGVHPSAFYKVLTIIQTFNPLWIIKRYAGKDILLDGLLLENASGERLFFKAPEEILKFRSL